MEYWKEMNRMDNFVSVLILVLLKPVTNDHISTTTEFYEFNAESSPENSNIILQQPNYRYKYQKDAYQNPQETEAGRIYRYINKMFCSFVVLKWIS